MKPIKLPGFKNIYVHADFIPEFQETVRERDNRGRYHTWLRKKLSQLDELGYAALGLRDFEYISNSTQKIKSIRYSKSEKNPRVLFVFFQGEKAVLLSSFLEKSKQNNVNYEKAQKIAENRLKALDLGE